MKNKKIKVFICLIVFVLSSFWVVVHVEGICSRVLNIKEYFENEVQYKERHKEKADLSDYEALADEIDAWYTKYHFISHAGGGIEGRTYTNAKQAWELSYEKGNRVIDADMAFTTDGILVLRHSWGDQLENTGGGEIMILSIET